MYREYYFPNAWQHIIAAVESEQDSGSLTGERAEDVSRHKRKLLHIHAVIQTHLFEERLQECEDFDRIVDMVLSVVLGLTTVQELNDRISFVPEHQRTKSYDTLISERTEAVIQLMVHDAPRAYTYLKNNLPQTLFEKLWHDLNIFAGDVDIDIA